MEKLKLSIDHIVDVTDECRAVVFDAIAAGHLETFLVGRRRFARPEAVKRWIALLEAQSRAGKPVAYRSRAREQARRALRVVDGESGDSSVQRRAEGEIPTQNEFGDRTAVASVHLKQSRSSRRAGGAR